MGNTNSTADFEHSIAAKDYKLIKKVKDRHFGEIIHMKNHKNGNTVLMREYQASDQEAYHKMIEDCSYYASLKHKNLGIVYGFTGADNHEIFKNSSHRICVYFEYLQNTLESTLLKKKIQLPIGSKQVTPNINNPSNFYEEHELFQMMLQLISVLEYLQQNGVSHGEIRPASCFVNNEGSLKLFNRKLLCEGESAYQKAKKGDTSLFLTPFEFESIGRQKPEPVQDKYRADVFSLGMTLLECATLKKSAQLYDWNNYTINLNLLSTRLLEVKERYASFIYEMLREMMRFEEAKRPDFITLKHYLSEEGRTNLSLVSLHHIEEEDHLLKQLVQDIPSRHQTSRDQQYNTFFYKFIADSGSAKIEQKIVPVGDTPLMTRETVHDLAACSIPSTYREENVEEDLLESQACSKIHEIQGQSLVPVSKKFRTINSDLTSILMQRNDEHNNSSSDNRINPQLGTDPVHRKSPETELSILSRKAFQDHQEVSQVLIESPGSKNKELNTVKSEMPVIEEFFYTPVVAEISRAIEIKDYSSSVQDSSPYALVNGHPGSQSTHNYDYDYSPAKPATAANAIQQRVRESLERARKCRESLHRPEDRALFKDALNSSTATFGAETHVIREEVEPLNTRLYNSEYKRQADPKKGLLKPHITHYSPATKDILARDYPRNIYKYQSAKKEATSSLLGQRHHRYDSINQSMEHASSNHGTPDFSARKPKRAVSNARYSKRPAEPYDAYSTVSTEKDYCSIPVQRILSFATPERVRDYSQMYERNLRNGEIRVEASTEEFVSESNNNFLLKEKSRRDSHKPSALDECLPEMEETFQKAMERTQLTKEFMKKVDENSRNSLPRRSLNA